MQIGLEGPWRILQMVMILEPSQVASQLVGGQEQARVSILTSGPMLQPYDSGLSAVAWPGHRTILRRPQATALSFLVLLAVALITPIYNEVMVGISSPPPTRPSHAWVSVDEVDGGRLVESRREQASDVDVAIRQAWVRGPWMRALERQTLATAAAVEDRLAPYGSGAATAVGRGAAIHSLLDHWDHSAEQMASDDDVVGTVVGPSSRRLSRAGVSLRPESTLAGFARASSSADAVVTTMLCDDGSDAARFWDRSVAALLRDPAKWHASLDETLDGILARIQHLPAGTSDNVAFFTLYSAAAIYGWVGLSEHGMLKSRLWLLMYIFAEVGHLWLSCRICIMHHIYHFGQATISYAVTDVM